MTGDLVAVRPSDMLTEWPSAAPVLLLDDRCGFGPASFDGSTLNMLMRRADDLILSSPVRTRLDERSRRHCLLAAQCRRAPILYVETADPESWQQAWRRRHAC